MSTSAITQNTRGHSLGTRERRSIERRVREAQAELLRKRRARTHSLESRPRRVLSKRAEGADHG